MKLALQMSRARVGLSLSEESLDAAAKVQRSQKDLKDTFQSRAGHMRSMHTDCKVSICREPLN